MQSLNNDDNETIFLFLTSLISAKIIEKLYDRLRCTRYSVKNSRLSFHIDISNLI